MSNINKQDHIYSGKIPDNVNFLKKFFYKILFSRLEISDQCINKIKECSEKGVVVYSLFQSSPFSLIMFYYILKKNGIKTPKFALDYNPIYLQTLKILLIRIKVWIKKNIFRSKYPFIFDTDYIEKLLENDDSIIFPILSQKFFLRRYLETKYDTLKYLIELQKKTEKPIYVFSSIIFWNRNPERTNSIFSLKATGHKSCLSGIISMLSPSFIRGLEPINLQDELEIYKNENSDDIALKVRNSILEKHQAEKRHVLGPILKSRAEMMEKILYHDNVINVIEQISKEDNIPIKKLKKKAFKHYREIAADFSARYVNFFGIILDYIFNKIFRGIDSQDDAMTIIREAAKKGTVVFMPCHKSHMDYLILSYLLFKNKYTAPHIAAGVNLSFFPIGKLFRHCGAFFIRRTFKGLKLYPVIFKQYVKTLVNEEYPLEFFIEGGRTRTGRLVFPKYGFMNYLIEAVDEGYQNDLVFLPISITYDRIMEESSYVKELKGKNKKKESVGSIFKNFKILKRDYGQVHVTFDKPFTLKDVENDGFSDDDRAKEIATRVIKGINKVTVVNPFSLASTAMLLMSSKGFSKKDLSSVMEQLYDYLIYSGVKISESTGDKSNINKVLENVISLYKEDNIIEELTYDEGKTVEDVYVLRDDNRPRIAFYKNTIQHFLVGISVASISLLFEKQKSTEINIDSLHEHFAFFKDLFSREFLYTECLENIDKSIEKIMQEYMNTHNMINYENNVFTINEENHKNVIFYAQIVHDLLESYYIVLKSLCEIKSSKFNKKDFITAIRKNGVKMFHTGEIMFSESLSLPNYLNMIKKIVDLGYVEEKYISRKNSKFTIKNKDEIQVLTKKVEDYLKAIK